MQRKKLVVLLAAIAVASVVVSAVGLSGTIYTWEKTFEVKKPEIECEIEIGDNRIVGCPVKVWVCLKLENVWRDCCWVECKDEYNNDCKDNYRNCLECCCQINGTYSVNLYWYNETAEDWEHVKYLQEETNITIPCFKYMRTYMFIPMWEGEYKVVVTLTVDSEVYNFTNES